MDGYLGTLLLFAGNFPPRNWMFCQGQLLPISQNAALFALIGTTYGGDGTKTFGLPDLRGRVPVGTGQGQGLPNVVQGEKAGAPTVTLGLLEIPAHNHVIDMKSAGVTLNMTATGTIKAGAAANGNFPATTAPVTGDVAIPVNSKANQANSNDPGAGLLANTSPTNIYSTRTFGVYSGGPILLTNGKASIPQPPLALPVTGSVDVPINTTAPITGTAVAHPAGGSQPHNNMQPYLGLNYIICTAGTYPSKE